MKLNPLRSKSVHLTLLLVAAALMTACMSHRMEQKLSDHDTNGDGYLSMTEFKTTRIARKVDSPESFFHLADANNDSLLSLDEIKSHIKENK